MARLFITPREIDYMSDLTKEVTKDIIGQKIFYYKVREDLSSIHDVYEEAPEKIFNPPVELDALVDWQPEMDKIDKFGAEEISKIDVYVHERDLVDKDFVVSPGDYFNFGKRFFEITSVNEDKIMYGQVEYLTGYKLSGKQARAGQINFKPQGPTTVASDEAGAIQDTFVQQRGFEENSLGKTNDVRALQDNGKLEEPLSQPQEVSNKGAEETEEPPKKRKTSTIDSSFYGDE